MPPAQWDIFKRAARMEKLSKVPMAMIIDSPWIPGYVGVKHMDFFLDLQVRLEPALRIEEEIHVLHADVAGDPRAVDDHGHRHLA